MSAKSRTIIWLSLIISTGLQSGCQSHSASPSDRPHVLFILTDDQGYGDLSLHGNDILSTPHTDKLLTESARFSRFYVSPVCAPTRASFLSGQYHPRTGAYFVTRRAETMTDSVITVAELLQSNGYRTGLFGKWHNGATYPYDPPGQGFDEFLGFTMGHYNSYYDYELRDEAGETVPFDGYLTDVLTDSAFHFLTDSDQAGLPAFCMLAYQAPHTPVQAPDTLFEKYSQLGISPYDAGIYAMIEANDRAIGRLLRKLSDADILDNIIVIFSTDNGPNGDRYNGGLKGRKGQVDEGGVRVPFGIKLPGKHRANGTVIDTIAAHIDLLPTLAELTGTTLPADLQFLDGKSLVPLLNGQPVDWSDRRVYTFIQGYAFSPFPGAMRTQDRLYVLRAPGRHEYYDLKNDPGQQRNLFDSSRTDHLALANDFLGFGASVVRPDLVAPPIEVGHREAPIVRLSAHEGEPFGRAAFHDTYGWANDWVEKITTGNDGISWPLNVIRDGAYALDLYYAVNGENGSEDIEIVIQAAGRSYPIRVAVRSNADLPTRDLVPRKEVAPRKWHTTTIRVELAAGRYDVFVRPNRELARGELLVKEVVIRK